MTTTNQEVKMGVFMFLIQSLTLFLTDKKLDDCSSSTLDFYGYTVGKLVGYMGEKYGEIGVEDLQEHVQEYFLWLKEESMKQQLKRTTQRCQPDV